MVLNLEHLEKYANASKYIKMDNTRLLFGNIELDASVSQNNEAIMFRSIVASQYEDSPLIEYESKIQDPNESGTQRIDVGFKHKNKFYMGIENKVSDSVNIVTTYNSAKDQLAGYVASLARDNTITLNDRFYMSIVIFNPTRLLEDPSLYISFLDTYKRTMTPQEVWEKFGIVIETWEIKLKTVKQQMLDNQKVMLPAKSEYALPSMVTIDTRNVAVSENGGVIEIQGLAGSIVNANSYNYGDNAKSSNTRPEKIDYIGDIAEKIATTINDKNSRFTKNEMLITLSSSSQKSYSCSKEKTIIIIEDSDDLFVLMTLDGTVNNGQNSLGAFAIVIKAVRTRDYSMFPSIIAEYFVNNQQVIEELLSSLYLSIRIIVSDNIEVINESSKISNSGASQSDTDKIVYEYQTPLQLLCNRFNDENKDATLTVNKSHSNNPKNVNYKIVIPVETVIDMVNRTMQLNSKNKNFKSAYNYNGGNDTKRKEALYLQGFKTYSRAKLAYLIRHSTSSKISDSVGYDKLMKNVINKPYKLKTMKSVTELHRIIKQEPYSKTSWESFSTSIKTRKDYDERELSILMNFISNIIEDLEAGAIYDVDYSIRGIKKLECKGAELNDEVYEKFEAAALKIIRLKKMKKTDSVYNSMFEYTAFIPLNDVITIFDNNNLVDLSHKKKSDDIGDINKNIDGIENALDIDIKTMLDNEGTTSMTDFE